MKTSKQQHRSPPLWLVNLIQTLRRFLTAIERKLVPAKFALLDMTFQFIVSKAIWAAAELNIAQHLRKGPRSIGELADLTHTHTESLYRLMRLLTEHGVFKQVKPRVFALTRLARALFDEDGSLRPMIRFICGDNNWESFAQLLKSVRTGKSSLKRNSRETFKDLKETPQLSGLFNNAMTALSELAGDAIIAAYDFSPFATIADIGGGEGTLIAKIMNCYPHNKGILFDLPYVVEQIEPVVQSYQLSSRLHLEKGDFFTGVPAGHDSYILKNVLHDWDDAHCLTILRNINQAMGAESILLIIEVLITNTNTSSIGTLFDLQLLVSVDGGRERTQKEFRELLSHAHFEINRIVPTYSGLSIIECKKH